MGRQVQAAAQLTRWGLYAELQDHNKKLQTKIRKLEADFTALVARLLLVWRASQGGRGVGFQALCRERQVEAVSTSIKDKYKELEVNLNKKKRGGHVEQKAQDGTADNTASRGTLAVSASQEIDIRAGATTKRPASAKASGGRAPEASPWPPLTTPIYWRLLANTRQGKSTLIVSFVFL